ncbi:MAG: RNA-directed DNA polymerase [Oscillospiraceae bacterium]|nr:RNA-directed DNA polymerase [Oscillospiraceae bacterium]
MIVYRELSSLETDLGVSAKVLYTLSNSRSSHYHTVMLPKENGELRQLSVPDGLLKSVQRKIARQLLVYEEVSPYAMAYRLGGSTLHNAVPHVGQPMVMKLDIRKFFDHCFYPLVKEKAFPAARYSEPNRVLLSLLCVYHDALPQGAPTSPAISNIILRDFDNAVGSWCAKRHIVYTRYCDDMTFSGSFDPAEVKTKVRTELRKVGLFLNDNKTVVLNGGQRQTVTGIVVNERVSVPSDYRRKLRQELYYCRKYGIAAHLEHIGSEADVRSYERQLLGRVNYVLYADPCNQEMQEYRRWLQNTLTGK